MNNWLQNYFEIECRDSYLFIYLSFLNLRGLDGANGLIEKNDPIKQKDIQTYHQIVRNIANEEHGWEFRICHFPYSSFCLMKV